MCGLCLTCLADESFADQSFADRPFADWTVVHRPQHHECGSRSESEEEERQSERASAAQEHASRGRRAHGGCIRLGGHAFDHIQACGRSGQERPSLDVEAPDDGIRGTGKGRKIGSLLLPCGRVGHARSARRFGRDRPSFRGLRFKAALIGVGNFLMRTAGRALSADRLDRSVRRRCARRRRARRRCAWRCVVARAAGNAGLPVPADDLGKLGQGIMTLTGGRGRFAQNRSRDLAQLPLDIVEIGGLHRAGDLRTGNRRGSSLRGRRRGRSDLAAMAWQGRVLGNDPRGLRPGLCGGLAVRGRRRNIRARRIDEVAQLALEFIEIDALN
jgi:hypothetical protein